MNNKESNRRLASELMSIARLITAGDEGAGDVHPKVYVGTYAKYASGSIDGKWVDLTDFDNEDDFLEKCREIHSDEEDPELMFQDYEGFPSKYYSESHIDPEVWDYIEKIEDYDKDVVDAILDDGYDLDAVDDAIVYAGCDSMRDVVYQLVDEMGHDAFSDETWEVVFDYDHFGRELQWDMDEDEIEAYDGMSDEDIGIQYVEEIGGLKELGDETIEAYADYDKLGDMLECDGNWISYGDGYIQVIS